MLGTYLLTSLTVIKAWQGETPSAERPESVTVELLQNGEHFREAEVTAEAGWTYRFESLPKYDENGELYVYTVREVSAPDGYRVSYSNGTNVSEEPGAGYTTIVNTYTRRVISGIIFCV